MRPYEWLARVDRQDVLDLPPRAAAWWARFLWYAFSRTQTGQLRWYAAGIAAGAVAVIAIVVFL